jgi:hypothetical protein
MKILLDSPLLGEFIGFLKSNWGFLKFLHKGHKNLLILKTCVQTYNVGKTCVFSDFFEIFQICVQTMDSYAP